MMLRNSLLIPLLLTLLISPLSLFANDEEDLYRQDAPAPEETSGELKGQFRHKNVAKGWGWEYTCPAETKYVVDYSAKLDEPTLNINFLDGNKMDVTVWIRDISLDVSIYHSGKKTLCQEVNVASAISVISPPLAPIGGSFKAHADSFYLHVILTPMSLEDEEGNEMTQYDALIKSNTGFYDLNWTNWSSSRVLPAWINEVALDALSYHLNDKLQGVLSSEAAYELSDKLGVELTKRFFTEE